MINLIYLVTFLFGFIAHWLALILINKRKAASIVGTSLRNAKAQKLQHKRFMRRDLLTGLQSRNSFIKRTNRLTRKADAEGELVGFISVDVKSFCRVNETYGFKVGDSILKEVSERFDFVDANHLCRLDGDEFIIATPDIDNTDELYEFCENIVEKFKDNFIVNLDEEIHLEPSIGVSLYPLDCKNCDELISYAKKASKIAATSACSIMFFNDANCGSSKKDIEMETKIHQAISNNEFEAHLQAITSDEGEVVAAESLIRWNHNRTLISPAEFIPIAENSTIIVELGAIMLRDACAAANRFITSNMVRDDFIISVNVSLNQFQLSQFDKTVIETLKCTGLPAKNLQLEITETAFAESEDIKSQIDKISKLGVRIVLDDFGTGYSSLSYIRDFNISGFKIDRKFVVDMVKSQKSLQLVKAFASIAASMELDIVAEGVETNEQYNALISLGITKFQGFMFHRPESVQAFSSFLTQEEKSKCA